MDFTNYSYLYPVHLQRFPSKHFSTSSRSGVVPHDEFFSWAEKKLWNIFSWSQNKYVLELLKKIVRMGKSTSAEQETL